MRKLIFIQPRLVAIVTAVFLTLAGCEPQVTPPVQAAPSDSESPGAAPTTTDHQDATPQDGNTEVTPTHSTTTSKSATPGTVDVANANVEAVDIIDVPSQEAGVIRQLMVSESDSVTEEDVMGLVDDDRAQIELQLARIDRDTSKEQAENDVNVKYAIAAEQVAKIEHTKALEANVAASGTFPEIEVKQLELVHQRSEFQVEQAKLEQKIARMTLVANEAKVKAAEKSLARRQIIAPHTGKVVKVYKRAGEWVDPGDPILRLVRSDRMRVEGYMNAREYDPHTVIGKPVSVTVELAHGRKVTVRGVVKLPDLTIETDGKYRIWAEVENKKDGTAWLLRPGQRATMSVRVE